MGLPYYSGFKTVGNLNHRITVAGSPITIPDGRYAYLSFSGTNINPSVKNYVDYGLTLRNAIIGTIGGSWTVNFNQTTFRYTISRATNFTLSWTTDAELRCRQALGFTGSKSGANSYTSDIQPYYMNLSAIDGRMVFSDVYEPDDITTDASADDGTPYGMSRDINILCCDWTQGNESKSATQQRSATTVLPYTWQAFRKHIRAEHPFAVTENGVTTVYKLRADNTSHVPQRLNIDDDTYWQIPFRTWDLGNL